MQEMDRAVKLDEQEYQAKSAAQQKALDLLGAGVKAEAVAAAVGVTPAYISQLLSNENFASAVASKRYAFLAANNQRDEKYNSLEDKLIGKLEGSLALMIRPAEITKALHTINNCKRRGQNTPEAPTNNKQTIVQLIIPTQIAQKFTTNIVNQVVSAGEQELLTMPSNMLLQHTEKKLKELPPAIEPAAKPETTTSPNPLLEELGG